MATQMTLSLIQQHKITLYPAGDVWMTIIDNGEEAGIQGEGKTPFDAVRDVVRKFEASKQS